MLKTMTHRLPAFQATRGKPEGGQPMTRNFKIKLLVAAIAAVPMAAMPAATATAQQVVTAGPATDHVAEPVLQVGRQLFELHAEASWRVRCKCTEARGYS